MSVQSMTTTKTADVEGTLAQVYALRGAGADIVRITCNDVEAAQALAEIVPRSPVPIVADIHFQYKLARCHGAVRVASESGEHPQRGAHQDGRPRSQGQGPADPVGVNAGSLDKDLLEKYGGPVPEALVESALKEIRYLEEVDFTDIKISVKHSRALHGRRLPTAVGEGRLPAAPGVTEAGRRRAGSSSPWRASGRC